ncbi:hypothetical protein, partial [Nocardiopsis dassonvillei]
MPRFGDGFLCERVAVRVGQEVLPRRSGAAGTAGGGNGPLRSGVREDDAVRAGPVRLRGEGLRSGLSGRRHGDLRAGLPGGDRGGLRTCLARVHGDPWFGPVRPWHRGLGAALAERRHGNLRTGPVPLCQGL